ncbi:hypothetical protein MMC12_007057 [Toensbergia leucococca]|nr:hypothetical protein [Toensbergia leucococca]
MLPLLPDQGVSQHSQHTHLDGNLENNGTPKLQFDTIEDTIEAFRHGEFIIVLDSTSRENEGDLIIAASEITTEKMAFMIHHTSGLICTPVSSSLTTSLDLPQMVLNDNDIESTAYTVSIDASDVRITTGISAYDRALTCRTLASKSARPDSFRRPGHVFPLRAKDGGVRERRGYTEATIEFCKLARKAPAGVLSELVDNGEEVEGRTERIHGGMTRRNGCLMFGRRWGIRVCTIEALVEYLDGRNAEDKINGHV